MLAVVLHYLHLMLNSICGKQSPVMVCTMYTKERTAPCSVMIAETLKLSRLSEGAALSMYSLVCDMGGLFNDVTLAVIHPGSFVF